MARWFKKKKIRLSVQETRVRSLGREDPLKKEMAADSSVLAWEIPWTEEPGRHQSVESQRVRHDLTTEQVPEMWVPGCLFCLHLNRRWREDAAQESVKGQDSGDPGMSLGPSANSPTGHRPNWYYRPAIPNAEPLGPAGFRIRTPGFLRGQHPVIELCISQQSVSAFTFRELTGGLK